MDANASKEHLYELAQELAADEITGYPEVNDMTTPLRAAEDSTATSSSTWRPDTR